MEAGGFSWQPREVGGWGFENLQFSVGMDTSAGGLAARL